MKTFIGWLSVSLFIPFQLLCGLAQAQTVCGPYTPFARSFNADGTETVTMNASCQNPDPANWDHIYTFIFPTTLTYLNGTVLQFVGSASAYIEGHDDCVARYGCPRYRRLVTVDNASLTDPSGNSLPLMKVEFGTRLYPVDAWESTTPLLPDTQYSFEASGTANSGMTDIMHIQAIYQDVTPPPPPCSPNCED